MRIHFHMSYHNMILTKVIFPRKSDKTEDYGLQSQSVSGRCTQESSIVPSSLTVLINNINHIFYLIVVTLLLLVLIPKMFPGMEFRRCNLFLLCTSYLSLPSLSRCWDGTAAVISTRPCPSLCHRSSFRYSKSWKRLTLPFDKNLFTWERHQDPNRFRPSFVSDSL